MPNPLFNAMGSSQQPMNFMQAFPKFMEQMKGKNPNEVLNEMLTSGKINQSQLDQAQKMARNIEGKMNGFKAMFGFK